MKYLGDSYIYKLIAASLALGALALSSPVIVPIHALTEEELQQAIDKKSQELEAVNKKIQETQQTLQATAAKGKTLQSEIGRIDKNINQVQLNIRSSELTIDKLAL